MSDAFDRAVEATLSHEGGYVNDPADPGGETKWGISKRSYPSVDIAALTRDAAIEIYRRDFWQRPKLDQLPEALALKLFDVAVNLGVGRAVMLLQRALRILGASLDADGVIGTRTIAAARQYPTDVLVAIVCVLQGQHYAAIIEHRPDQRRFAGGWFRRAIWQPTFPDPPNARG